ncbi:hypothetical protein ScPMuIL_012750 [Solemya velum]
MITPWVIINGNTEVVLGAHAFSVLDNFRSKFKQVPDPNFLLETPAMREKAQFGGVWAQNAMDRSTRLGQSVYERAARRRVEWPDPTQCQGSAVQDPVVYTSLDDAFSTVLQFMSQTTRQCSRFYKSNPHSANHTCDKQHCNRFHIPHYRKAVNRNPLQQAEDVHVVVSPGTYSVTAGAWGRPGQQTHVVNVDRGQSVNLDFVM